MSGRVPAGEILNEAFQFGFYRWLTVFRFANSFSDILNVSPFTAVVLGVIAAIILMVAFAGMFASVYRLVALGEDRPGFMQLRFDGPAQRVFMAQLILNAINYVIMIAASCWAG